MAEPLICIYGAGSIGCYVGGLLAAAGARVGLVGRARIGAEIAAHGLHLSDFRGRAHDVGADAVEFATDASVLSAAALILVTVKSAATADAAIDIARFASAGAVVVSLQNGIGNDAILRARLPGNVVLAGMVQFNVVRRGPGAFHHGSAGGIEVACDVTLAPFLPAFSRARLPLTQSRDIASVQWAKLLLNLNNAVNALSALPLQAQLAQRGYRRCTALAQEEGLRVLAANALHPARLTALPARWIPRVLRLPDPAFRLAAARMLAIDPLARSSMQDDLVARRPTEVEWLNGEIVRLAQTSGHAAPVNRRLVDLIHAAESGPPRTWAADALLAQLERAQRQ